MPIRLLPLFLVAIAIAPVRSTGRFEATAESQPLRISETGGVGSPAVAYNSVANEYLAAWDAWDASAGLVRVFGQRISAATGAVVGPNDFAISDTTEGAGSVAAAYNSAANEYLVVWRVGQAYRGRRIAADGGLVAAQISISPAYPLTSYAPTSIAYNAAANEYLMAYPTLIGFAVPDGASVTCPVIRCWYGTYQQVETQRLDAAGIALSTSGVASGQTMSGIYGPILFGPATVIWNPRDDEYVVAYTHSNAMRAARVNGTTGLIIGQSFAVGSAATGTRASVAHNADHDEYLVAWSRDGHVHGQLLTAAGIQTGADDFRIDSLSGGTPSVAYDGRPDEYLVTWDGEGGVRGQRLSATGGELGEDDFRLLPEGYFSARPAVVYGTAAGGYFVAMASTAPFLDAGRYEVFGSRYVVPGSFLIGLGRNGAGEAQPWEIDASGVTQGTSIQLPWPAYNSLNGELHPGMGDLDGDGLNEIVMGLGSGGDGWMAVFDDAHHGHALLTWVQIPWPSYNASNGTIWPSVGDIDGDGKAEIVAGLGAGGQGYYAIFDDAAHGYALLTWRRVSWPWYNTTQSGETRPAIANIDGGTFSEIVIGLGPGGGGWMELVDDAEAGYAHLRWLRVGWGAYISGPGETSPAAGDVDGDGYDEIVVGLGPNSQGWLQVFDDAFSGLVHKGWLQVSWSEYGNTNGETHPAVGDIDGDAAHEIVLGLGVFPGQGGWFEIRDDFTTGFASLGWRNVGRADFYSAGGATFPAAGRAP